MTPRAVIYARCSTEEESQKDALKKQVEEGKTCVAEQGWQLVDVYVESRSGTTTKGRTEYNRLYEDLSGGRFDIIVIKSQDRLMRNTKDWYLFVDRLSTEQKKLYMYIERKFYSTDDALITGIKAILAEEYSRELSKKSNNAHQNRQKYNGPVILTSKTYGYRKCLDKSVAVVEAEAAVKRRMYELCAAGFGSRKISAILRKEGIVNRNGKPFSDSCILRMLHNPLNKGTAVMNQRHYDFESKKTLAVPKEKQYVYENKVPPIVSEELWEAANREIKKRAEGMSGPEKQNRGVNRGKSQLSGKLYCGLCGSPFYRRTRRTQKNQVIVSEWKCKKYLETGRKKDGPDIEGVTGCNNIHLEEELLYKLLEQVCENQYKIHKKDIIHSTSMMLKEVFAKKDDQPEIDREHLKKKKLTDQLDLVLEKLLEGVISDDTYRRKQKELEQELGEIEAKIKGLEEQKDSESIAERRRSHIIQELENGNAIEKAAAAAMLEKADKVLVYPDYMEICFRMPESEAAGREGGKEEESVYKIKLKYGNSFNHKKKKAEEREMIIKMMQTTPQITAKMIAEKLGISAAGVNYKINILKKEGRICFHGSGGHGKWVVIKGEEEN